MEFQVTLLVAVFMAAFGVLSARSSWNAGRRGAAVGTAVLFACGAAVLLSPTALSWVLSQGLWAFGLWILLIGGGPELIQAAMDKRSPSAGTSADPLVTRSVVQRSTSARIAHVLVSRNHVQVTNLSTGERAEAKAQRPFSLGNVVIADFWPLEEVMVACFQSAGLRSKLQLSPRVIVAVQAERAEGLTPIEKRAVVDACLGAGAREARICSPDDLLGDDPAATFKHLPEGA